MAMRLPKSERSPSPSPPPPRDQRDAAIQELRKGSELATQLMAQLELIPELDRHDDALANVRNLSMSLSSSLYALRSEREHYCGSSFRAGPAAVISVSGGGGGGGGSPHKEDKAPARQACDYLYYTYRQSQAAARVAIACDAAAKGRTGETRVSTIDTTHPSIQATRKDDNTLPPLLTAIVAVGSGLTDGYDSVPREGAGP